MKNNNRKKPPVTTTWQIGKRCALFTALFLPGLAFAQVNISPVVSAGNSESYAENEPNLWFLLDDSGSMGPGWSGTPPYDPAITYIVPEDITNPTATYPSTNHEIWNTYYKTKMDILKSSLSVVLFNSAYSDLTDSVRIGFTSLHNNNKGGPGNTTLPTQILPVLPFYGANASDNRETVYKWLNSLYASGGTPLRRLYSNAVNQVMSVAANASSNNNPFLENPGEAPDATNNQILSCRRNYMLVMTDGQWNGSVSSGGIRDVRVYNSYTPLPDGKTYSPLAPYTRKKTGQTYLTIADIALAGWKADIDGNNSNNKLLPKNTNIGGQPAELPDNGYYSTNQDERIYWHPWNDPANWQHISTFTMGFGMSSLKVKDPDTNTNIKIDINPDGISPLPPAITTSGFEWDINKSGNYAVNDLANAALIGRGRYYDVQTPTDMINAFTDLFKEVNSINTPTVNGSAGTGGASQKLDNSYYISRYETESFTGELIKYNLYNGDPGMTCDTSVTVWGELCNTAWNAGETLTAAGPGSRKIITLKRKKGSTDLTTMNEPGLTVGNLKYEVVNFDTSEISPAQKTRLENAFPSELTAITPEADRLPALFDYIRGDDTNEEEVTGGTESFRSRNKHNYLNNIENTSDNVVARDILGAIMRSSPVFVGIPTGYVKHFEGAGSTYTNYINYLNNYMSGNSSGDNEVIYVGANDGMLHAFKANTGEELFAYIPSAVYDKLPETVVPKKQLSLVDGNMDVQSVYFGSDWYRVLVGGMGGGAKGLYALNITSPDINDIKSSSVLNWEYGDLESKLYQKAQGIALPKSNIGNILVKPAIIQLQDNTWVAIVGNGYNSESNKAAVIVINLETGEPIQELVLDTSDAYSDSAKPNGLGPLYFVSYPGKPRNKSNQYDRAYAGDLQGNLWVFDLEGSDVSTGIKVINQGSDTSGTPLFTAKDSGGERQPITVYPLVVKHPLNYGYLVHFGTGALFATDDLSSKVGNSIYAIWDDWVDNSHGGLPTARTSTVQDSELNEVKLKEETVTVKDGSDNPMDVLVKELDDANNSAIDWKLNTGTHRGWRIDLNDGSEVTDSERAWQPAFTAYGGDTVKAIAYNTITYLDEGSATICKTPGNKAVSWSLAFNGSDATIGLPQSGVLDINQDNNVTEADRKIKNASGDYMLQTINLIAGFTTLDPDDGSLGGGGILQNPTPLQLHEPPNCTGPSCPTPPPTTRTACRTVSQLTASSGGGVSPTTIERCSYFSSWTELK